MTRRNSLTLLNFINEEEGSWKMGEKLWRSISIRGKFFFSLFRKTNFLNCISCYCINVFSDEGVKFGEARVWVRRFETVKGDLYVSQALQVEDCNAIRPLTPFALMWIDWPLVNQSMINLNYSVLSGLNSYRSRRHLVSIDETNLPSVQLVNEIGTGSHHDEKRRQFFPFFPFFFNSLN